MSNFKYVRFTGDQYETEGDKKKAAKIIADLLIEGGYLTSEAPAEDDDKSTNAIKGINMSIGRLNKRVKELEEALNERKQSSNAPSDGSKGSEDKSPKGEKPTVNQGTEDQSQ